MLDTLGTAVRMLVILSLVTGCLYPLAVTGIAQLLMADRAFGSLLLRDGKPAGSALIGQSFADPKYFWGRSSATSPQPYDAMASGGSNLSVTNPALLDNATERVNALRRADPDNAAPVPVDLVSASASGLDPHISPAAAAYQVRRVARVRGMSVAQVEALVARFTTARDLGILGEARVNVLPLNLALDRRE